MSGYSFGVADNDHDLAAFGHLRILRNRDLRDRTVDRRNQSMLHFHSLNDSDPLAAGNARALLHQEGKHLAMHRCAYKAAFVLIPSLIKRCIA